MAGAPQQQGRTPVPLEIRGLKGLDLKADIALRDPTSFQQLENFDLFIDGTIRKVLPPAPYGTLALGGGERILNFIEYRQVNSDLLSGTQIIGVSNLGNLYDLTTGTLLGTLGIVMADIPFMGVLPGTLLPYNFRFWLAATAYSIGDGLLKIGPDGNLYVFSVTTPGTSNGAGEPMWPVSGTIADGGVVWTNQGAQVAGQFENNYLVIQPSGSRPFKYDGAAVTPLGASIPEVPCSIKSFQYVIGIVPAAPAYKMQVGVNYAYTWFNPRTLAESSPSLLTGPQVAVIQADNAFKTVNVAGSFLPAVVNQFGQATLVYEVQVQVPTDQLVPPYGSGYTRMRFWRTRDGGGQLFLLQTVYDNNNNPISDPNGASLPTQLPAAGNAYKALPVSESAVPHVFFKDGFKGNQNFIPDPILLGTWLDASIGPLAPGSASQPAPYASLLPVVPNAGRGVTVNGVAEASNAFVFRNPVPAGGSPGVILFRSIQFTVPTTGTYFFQGYIDALAATAGVIEWAIDTPDFTVVQAFAQTNGVAGIVSGTVALTGGKTYILVAILSAAFACPTGAQVILSDPLLVSGMVLSAITGASPIPDAALVTPAPGINSNGPPPSADLAAIYQGTLFLRDAADHTKIWYSGAYFENFGLSAFFTVPDQTGDPVNLMLGGYNRLIVAKTRSLHQIFGNDATNFSRQPIDPLHGATGQRSIFAIGSSLIGLLNQGLSAIGLTADPTGSSPANTLFEIGFTPESIIGEPILPLTKLLGLIDSTPCIITDDIQNLMLFAVGGSGRGANPNTSIIIGQLTKRPWFTLFSSLLGNGFFTIRQVLLPSGALGVLASGADGKMYQMWVGNPATSVVQATAITQPLPIAGTISPEVWGTRKLFKMLYVEGQDLNNFDISYSTDGGLSYFGPKILRSKNKIGREGKALIIKLQHNRPPSTEPRITYLGLDYDIMKEENTDDNIAPLPAVYPPLNPPIAVALLPPRVAL